MSDILSEKVTNDSIVNNENIKLPVLQVLGYASGDFANNFSWALIAAYLMYFWTDVALIPAALCGTFMLISKGIDAVIDPFIGSFADKTHTKWGRYRPWVIFAAIPMLILNILSFTVFPSENVMVRAIYAVVVYIALVVAYSCVNIPYSVMPATMTRDDNERSRLSSWRMTGAFIATLILSQSVLRVVEYIGKGNEAAGFTVAAVIFSCIALPIYIFCFKTTRETVEIPVSKEKVPFSEFLRVLKGNKPVYALIASFVCWGFYEAAIGATRMYYFKYYIGDSNLFMLNSSLMFLGRVIGTYSLAYLVMKVSNKRTLPIIGFAVSGIIMVIMNFLPVHTIAGLNLYHFMTFLTGIGGGLGLASLFGMVPDCSEVTHYKYHTHAIGFISSFINFAFQLGMALCTALVGWILAALGYIANAQQTQPVLIAINICMNLACGIILIIGAAALIFYNIDKKTYAEIRAKVELRILESQEL